MNASEQAHALLDQLAREHFYGSITFQLKDGQVALIRKEETILPNSAAPNGRTEAGYERKR